MRAATCTWPNLKFQGELEHRAMKFSFLFMDLNAVATNHFP